MATRKELLEIANRDEWTYFHGEDRCNHCAEYAFWGKHKDDCPLGILCKLIEDGVPE